MPADERTLSFIVIGVFMLLLMGIGAAMRRFNSNTSDYFRNGCRGTWWLIGASAFMSSFSAWTYTGLAGVAYEGGWTVVGMCLCGCAAWLVHVLFMARWFRQMRAVTFPEVLRQRFGPGTQQFFAWINVVSELLGGAMQLFALAVFIASVFGYNLQAVIIVVGTVAVFYSVSGGSWAVMATDFLQGAILLPVTLLLAVLCMMHWGGIGGFFAAIRDAGLQGDFHMVKDGLGKYSWLWFGAYFLHAFFGLASLRSAPRYFAAKDGREATRAAMLTLALIPITFVLVTVAAMTARMAFADAVAASGLSKTAEAAYAVAALQLLPKGVIGVVVVAMFAATMSSMDSGLNRNAAVFTLDIFPTLFGSKNKGLAEKTRLLLGQGATLGLGIVIVSVAYILSVRTAGGVLSAFLKIGALVSVPMTVPLMLCLFLRRAPAWSANISVMAALVPSALGLFSKPLFGAGWSYPRQIYTNVIVGAVAFLATMPFWRWSGEQYRERVTRFFERMHTPVDFMDEIGEANDHDQLALVGRFVLTTGALLALLVLVPNPWNGRGGILSVAGFDLALGGLMVGLAFRGRKGS